MSKEAPRNPPVLVERQDQISEFCAECRAEGRFAFDTEFVMEDRYESEICLIQLATESTVALIDPFLKLDLDPIWKLVCDPIVETIVHAGQEDLGLCVQHSGQTPRAIFDVQIAAGLVGFDYPLSLQRIVQSLLHVRIHKAKTLTDWRRRPLSASQVRYAAEDVLYLPAMHRTLCDRLTRLKRLSWAREEFRQFEDLSLYRRATEEKLKRVKGAGSLEGRALVVLHELLEWRDGLAQTLNRPVRTVVKDHLLVEIAKTGATAFAEVRDLRGLNISDKHVRELCQVVQRASEIPAERWPTATPREVEAPREGILVDLITAIVKNYCLDNGLAYSIVATKRSIRDFVRHRTIGEPKDAAEVELLGGWRGETVGVLLDELMGGRRLVRVETNGRDRALRLDPR